MSDSFTTNIGSICTSPCPEEKNLQVHQLKDNDVNLAPALKVGLLLRDGKPGEALIVLKRALDELNNKLAYNTIRNFALSALAQHAMGDEKRALALPQLALELGELENRIASVMREGEATKNLLRLAETKGITPTL